MQETFRAASWWGLVVGGIAAILITFSQASSGVGVAVLIGVVATWGAWHLLLSWLFGLRRQVRSHLKMAIPNATYLEKSIGESRLADLRRTLEQRYRDGQVSNGARRYGMGSASYGILGNLQHQEQAVSPLQWTTFESEEGEYENYPVNAVYFLQSEGGEPFVLALQGDDAHHDFDLGEEGVTTGRGSEKLRLFARSMEAGREILNQIVLSAASHSVYRGRLLHVSSDLRTGRQTIRISARPRVDMDQIVLPEEVLKVIRRVMSARLTYQGLLKRHGHSSKTGIMLHGPPGTGKTLLCKYLIGDCPDFTAIVPTGTDTETIREAFRLAVYLQPSMVVFEDVDLLTERRETSSHVSGLQELMNEMDGLVDATEAIVIMTTNRPEAIEPALASRPGRISQAICLPLPDDGLRERLLQLYTAKADVSSVDLARWVRRTEGASPAFLRELASRAIVFAAEESSTPADLDPVKLSDQNLDDAVHELVVVGGSLTANVLGFPAKADR